MPAPDDQNRRGCPGGGADGARPVDDRFLARVVAWVRGALSRGSRTLPVTLGAALVLLALAATLVSPVHALFTARSETVTNIITLGEDFDGAGGEGPAPFSLLLTPVVPADEGASTPDDEAEGDSTSGEGDGVGEQKDQSGESGGQPDGQPEGASGTDTPPADPPVEAVAPVEPSTQPAPTTPPAREEEKVMTTAPKTTDPQGDADA